MADSDQEKISLSYFQYLNDILRCKLNIASNEIALFNLPEWFNVHLNHGDYVMTCSRRYFEANKNHPKLKFVTQDEMMEAIQKQINYDRTWLEELRTYHDKQLAEHPGYEPEGIEAIRDKYLTKDSWERYEDRTRRLDNAEMTLALLKDPKTREDTLYRLHPRLTPTSVNDDDLYQEAVSLIARTQIASTSFLQHHLSIGYSKAVMLMERLENEGLVGRADGIHKREILIDHDGVKQEGESNE